MQFLSTKARSLRVVIEPRIAKEVGGSRVMQGMRGEFPAGKTIEFVDGEFNTDDEQLIAAIKAHPHYGTDFVSADANEEPVAPSDQSLAEQNEKKTVAEELGSACPKCGKQFKNAAAVNGHMLSHRNVNA